MASVYEIITQQIIEKLEKGVVPWRMPWNSCGAVCWRTQRPYRGINALLLEPGEYATFKAIQEAGGKIKKGAKSSIVVLWKWREVDGEDSEGEKQRVPFLRYYRVFEINSQVEGLESKKKDAVKYDHNPIEEAEKIMQGFKDCPPIKFAPGSAFYRPGADEISVPPIEDYKVPEQYYSTLFHEATHSTGHKKRLNREGITKSAGFGSQIYSKEELVAEIGAAMLCGMCGIDNSTIDNSAAYIKSWLTRLKEDPKMIVHAAAAAQKAADYIQGINYSESADQGEELSRDAA